MKIGVLTLPLHTNYGGILQAYALQQMLKRSGHEAVLLDRNRFPLPVWYLKPLVYGKRIIKKYLLRKRTEVFRERRINKELRIKEQFTRRFIQTHIDRFVFKKYSEIKNGQFDCLIVGSDQVWRKRYANSMLGGICHSFLDFAVDWDIHRLAFSASLGTDEWEFTESETETCRKLVKKFEFISVREQSGIELCRNHLGIEAELMADPTLLLTKEDYIQLFEKTDTPPPSGQMMVYVLDRTAESDAFVENMSKKLNMTPFFTNSQVNDHKLPINKRVQPPVENWLRGFYDADFIITDSFHACVFSIIFNKQFIAIGNNNRGMSRFESLLCQFGLEDRLIPNTQITLDLPQIDYKPINKKIEELRTQSLEKFQFLKRLIRQRKQQ